MLLPIDKTPWTEKKCRFYLKLIYYILSFNALLTIFEGIKGFIFIRSSAFLTPFFFYLAVISLGIAQFVVAIKFKNLFQWTQKVILGLIIVKIILNFMQNIGFINVGWLIFIIIMLFVLKDNRAGSLLSK